jgi:hypothetical protein
MRRLGSGGFTNSVVASRITRSVSGYGGEKNVRLRRYMDLVRTPIPCMSIAMTEAALATAKLNLDFTEGRVALPAPAERSAVWKDWMVGATGIEPVTHQLEWRGRTKKLG